tara:strand:- start:3204 stop:3980 length:777 start_codon:yes stop_codon:yes gene_type:complete
MNLGDKIAEGKTKVVYADNDDESAAFMYFKDDITAGDGAKHDEYEGTGQLSWEVNKHFFDVLREVVPTHYLGSPQERYTHVRRLDADVGAVAAEIIVRRVATGSYLKTFPESEEGDWFDTPRVGFYMKNDYLHDPKIDVDHLKVLKTKTPFFDVATEHGVALFLTLEKKFAEQRYQLMDLKFEEGFVNGKQVVIDDLSPGSMRVWPYVEGVSEIAPVANVMAQLRRDGMIDKQLYREGHPEELIMARFKQFADVTSRF